MNNKMSCMQHTLSSAGFLAGKAFYFSFFILQGY